MKQKILIGHPLPQERLDQLNQYGFEVSCISSLEDKQVDLLAMIQDIDGLFSIGHKVGKDLMDKGEKLRVIGNYGVGTDNIDVAYAKEKGIVVTNTPDAVRKSTASFAIGLMIAVMRKIVTTDRWIRQGDVIPFWGHNMVLGTEIAGKTLGIIGMGSIGRAVAKRARALDMEIIYHNRSRLANELEMPLAAKYVNLDELLRTADVVTIHTPLTPQTDGLIDKDAFAKMKTGSYFVNTARGGVADYDALLEALHNGHIAGAALDVFHDEPNVPEVFKEMDNVVLAPHNGSATRTSRDNMFMEAFGNIVAFLSGKEMTSRVV